MDLQVCMGEAGSAPRAAQYMSALPSGKQVAMTSNGTDPMCSCVLTATGTLAYMVSLHSMTCT